MIRSEFVDLGMLPCIEERETIYSWASRTHLLLGGSVGWSSKTLFGNTRASRCHDVPVGLAHLNHATRGLLGNPRNLITKSTALGAFLPYLSPTRRDSVVAAILAGDSALGLLRVGDRASRLSRLPTLRSCRICVTLDQSSLGSGCWRVIHQLPAVWVCPYHCVPLAEMQSTSSGWQLPDPNDEVRKSSLTLDASIRALGAVAAISASAFELDQVDLRSLRRAAIERLCQSGLISNPSRLPLERLHKSFAASPIGRAISGYEPLQEVLAKEAWLGDLLRDRVAPHPVKWALVWCWIWSDAGDETAAEAFRQAALGGRANALPSNQLELPLDELDRAERMCVARLIKAIDEANSIEHVALQVGARIPDVNRWFRRYPAVRDRWWARVREERHATKRARVEAAIEQGQPTSRRALISSCISEIAWLMRNEPATADSLLARVPAERSPQKGLF